MNAEEIHQIINKLCEDSGFDFDFGEMVLGTYLKQSIQIIEEVFRDLNDASPEAFIKISNNMHKLKGSSGNVRALNVMTLAIKAETYAKALNVSELQSQVNNIYAILQTYQEELLKGDN